MINTLGYSHPSSYFLRSGSRPVQHETKRFLDWAVLLLFLLVPGASASAQTTLTPATLSFGDHVINVTSGAKTATLTNTQTVALTTSSIAIGGGTAPTDYVLTGSGNCPLSPQTLGPGESCTITVKFTPSALGSRTATLTVTDNASTSPQTAALTGTGTSPVTVSPSAWTFASRTVGTTSAAKTFKLTNHLNSSLPVSTPVATGDFAVASNTCGTSVGPLRTCTVGVTFMPTVAGSQTGTLALPYSAFGSPTIVTLNGTGIVPYEISVSPANPAILLPVGQTTQQFTATGYFKKSATQDLTTLVTWSSSAPGIATISAAGVATAVVPGETTITAAFGGVSSSTTLNVTDFVYTGSLNTPRLSPTASLLNDGMVLMAGGSGDTTAELYNPATGTFSYTPGNMIVARGGQTATLLNNGLVLIAGGYGYSDNLAVAELYNPATGTFTPTGIMTTTRYYHTATLLNNGMVLIVGGWGPNGYLASAELYNPTTGTFTATGSLSATRIYHTATLLNDGMVLVAGGDTFSSASKYGCAVVAELYNPATGTFTPTGSLNAARGRHTATLLNNGLVLMAGGGNSCVYDSLDPIDSAELYNPATASFTLTGSLNSARESHTATLLNNGLVLMVGGYGFTNFPEFSAIASAELYDPATGAFTLTGSLNTARVLHTATLLNNGMALMAGGQAEYPDYNSLASAELYGPDALTSPDLQSIAISPATSTLSPGTTQQFIATGTFSDGSAQQLASVTWSSSIPAVAQISNDASNHGLALAFAPGTVTITAAAGSISGSATLTVRPTGFVYTTNLGTTIQSTLNTARYDHTSTQLNDGTALFVGGTFNGSTSLSSAESYNPALGTFTTLTATLHTARFRHTATLLSDGTVLIVGGTFKGDTPLGSAEIYNPTTGTFSYTTAPLNTVRYLHTATLLNDGTVLIAGGYNSSGPVASAELYNPATGTFTYTTGSLNAARENHTATLLDDGQVLVAGGDGSNGILASAELYNPATGAFTYTTGSLNSARHWHTATLLSNGTVLLAGGHDSSVYLGSAELYDPAAGTFALTGSLNAARGFNTATLLNNGQVLIAGGYTHSAGYLASAELYNPATGTFTLTGDLNTARAYATATLLNNGMVLIAGGENSSGAIASAELY
jgi:hypothetical protein